ncbi:hypothetical protein G6F59_014622 [Rhizopus arrhizus]|nr:hypothetical protein G6F59_014622 [Rhizopus arrhizus]
MHLLQQPLHRRQRRYGFKGKSGIHRSHPWGEARHVRQPVAAQKAGFRSGHHGPCSPQSASWPELQGHNRPQPGLAPQCCEGGADRRQRAPLPCRFHRPHAHDRPGQPRQPADLRARRRHPQLRRDRAPAGHLRLGRRQVRCPAGTRAGRATVPSQHAQHHPHRRGPAVPGALPAHPRRARCRAHRTGATTRHAARHAAHRPAAGR